MGVLAEAFTNTAEIATPCAVRMQKTGGSALAIFAQASRLSGDTRFDRGATSSKEPAQQTREAVPENTCGGLRY